MGYTHYYTQHRNFTDDEWAAVCADAKKLMQFTSVPIQWDEDVEKEPEIGGEVIRFNGAGEDGHKTFFITRNTTVSKFNFCKTAGKPYDEVVCAVLAIVDYHARGVLEIGSDGDLEDWEPGFSLIRLALPPDRAAGVRLTFELGD